MSRPIVGTNLKLITVAEDLPWIVDLEFRDDNGIYWVMAEDGLCHHLHGGAPTWGLNRVLAASTGPVIVTYVPTVPSPHTKPGVYVCSEQCRYRFERMPGDLWQGPWNDHNKHVGPKTMMSWEELEESYGDCSRNLVGPVPTVFLKGY